MITRQFRRYELKYIIPVEISLKIREELEEFCIQDPYSGPQGYYLASLYYDSPDYDFFWDKIDGRKYRKKVRLRIYPEDPIESTCYGMVEIKQQINGAVHKRRIRMKLDDAVRLCAEGVFDGSGLDPSDRQCAVEVQHITRAMRLEPVCITCYHRHAYSGGDDFPGLRITFDTGVSYRTHNLRINESAECIPIIPDDWCIAEVKADFAVPERARSLFAKYHCSLNRVSKYCTSIALDREHAVLPHVIAFTGDKEVFFNG